MNLRSLSTRDFRNLEEGAYAFHPRANLIVGENGQGKTNLLEAIYFLATTRSFRTARPANLIRIGSASTFVEGVVQREGVERTLSIGLQAEPERRRELRLNGQPATLSRYVGAIHLFAYSAARLEILRGGPDERRRFLDRGIAGLHPDYLTKLTKFGRAVQQRNALLQDISRKRSSPRLLEPWDEEFLEAATPIIQSRAEYLRALTEEFRGVVEAHRYHVQDLSIRYEASGVNPEAGAASLRDTLSGLRPRELATGFTLAGPHRDNVAVEIRGRPAVEVLSSGEIKMVVLFLKFAKMRLYQDRMEDPPIFLLDDIDAELDLGIIERLLAYIGGSVQIFATSAKASVFNHLHLGSHRLFQLRGGQVTAATDEDLPGRGQSLT